MQTNLITLDRTLGKKILFFFNSPFTSLFIAMLISTFFYLLSLTYKTPSYYITTPELIAQKTDEKLIIQYDNVEIDNIYVANLILWNDGDKIIDYNDFIEDRPIKLFTKDAVKILSVSISKTSRSDLKFKYKIDIDTVKISLKTDEAFEEGDGAKFLILFTKKNGYIENPSFSLESRIKGTKYGFEFKDLTNFKSDTNKISLYILWAVIIFFTAFRIIVLYTFKKPIVFRKIEAVIIFSLIVITSCMTLNHIFYTTNLNWI